MSETHSSARELTGIIEYTDWLHCCYGHPGAYWRGYPEESRPAPTAPACLEMHLAKGIRNVLWSCGRSVVTYHSQDPRITRTGQGSDLSRMDAFNIRAVKYIANECPLRSALDYARRHGMSITPHLCMNSNHRGAPGLAARPDLWEVNKDLTPDTNRLCLGTEDYGAQRLAIIGELIELGDAVCLDFVRQPPMMRYHPALVDPYRAETGINPVAIQVDKRSSPRDLEMFMDWCRYRASILTKFMRKAKALADDHAARLGRPVPLIVRIDDSGLDANMISGIDIAAWCHEGLLTGIIIHPLQWIHGLWTHDAAPYVDLGRRTGVKVTGGVNTYAVEGWLMNPVCIARRMLQQYRAGVDGMSFYETNVTLLQPEMEEVLSAAGDCDSLARLLEDEAWLKKWPVNGLNANCGMDNHSALPSCTNLLSQL